MWSASDAAETLSLSDDEMPTDMPGPRQSRAGSSLPWTLESLVRRFSLRNLLGDGGGNQSAGTVAKRGVWAIKTVRYFLRSGGVGDAGSSVPVLVFRDVWISKFFVQLLASKKSQSALRTAKPL